MATIEEMKSLYLTLEEALKYCTVEEINELDIDSLHDKVNQARRKKICDDMDEWDRTDPYWRYKMSYYSPYQDLDEYYDTDGNCYRDPHNIDNIIKYNIRNTIAYNQSIDKLYANGIKYESLDRHQIIATSDAIRHGRSQEEIRKLLGECFGRCAVMPEDVKGEVPSSDFLIREIEEANADGAITIVT